MECPARRARREVGRDGERRRKTEDRGSSSKFENAPEINQKTWNLELGTLNLIGLMAES